MADASGPLDDRAAPLGALARSREVAAAWRASEAYRAVAAHFDAVPAADAEAVAAAAAALFADTAWLAALLAPLTASLAADDAFEPAFKVQRDAMRIGAVLFEHPAVAISAATLSADALAQAPPPHTVVVPGRLAVVRYHRAGGARWRRWAAEAVTPDFSAATAAPCRPLPDRLLVDGMVVRQDGRVGGGMLVGARGDVTTLTATIRGGGAPLMREYAIRTGALVRVATLDAAGSRTAMLLTLLRLSGRHDAGPEFEAASRSPAFDLRWTAMREWLALDVVAALPRLRAMADGDPHDEVRAAAQATMPVAEAHVAAQADHRLAA